jgi:hypothetical protein
VDAQRPRDEPPGQPKDTIEPQAKRLAGRVGSIELLGARREDARWLALVDDYLPGQGVFVIDGSEACVLDELVD